MRKKPEKLSHALGRMLNARGMGGRLEGYRVLGQWEKSVGPVIARHAQPQTVRGKKLTLVVDSPAWMQQLSLLKPEILDKVNRGLGKTAIKDIALRLGEVGARVQPSEGPVKRTVLGQDECMKIEEYLRGISDADVREAIRRVIEKDFLNRKPGG